MPLLAAKDIEPRFLMRLFLHSRVYMVRGRHLNARLITYF